MTFFACILLRDFVDFLPPEEQWRLSIGLNEVFNFSKLHDSSIGSLELGLNYWGPEDLVLGLESIPLKDSLIPTEKESKELNPPIETKENGGKDVAGINDPFFWNPINSNKNSKKTNNLILVESDPIEFMITLSNPLDIALEILEIKLSTIEVKFQSHPVSTVVPPKSLQTLKLTGVPRESGNIVVKGCWITLLGCLKKEFTVPLHEVETEKARIEEKYDLLDKKSRFKNWGLDSRPFIQNLKREELILSALNEESEMEPSIRKRILKPRFQDTYLKGKVLPSQPLLSIVSTSLNHGNLVLFQGETKILKIKLQDSGHLPIDFLKFSFDDDLTTSTKTALLEGDLLAEDSHSLEYDLIHRPIFTLDSKMKSIRDVNILPGEIKIIKIKVRGKLDCENASIRLEYGHLNAPGRGGLVIEESKNFFTRSIEWSFKLTVYPIVDLSPIEILPIRKGQALKLLAHSITSLDQSNDHSN